MCLSALFSKLVPRIADYPNLKCYVLFYKETFTLVRISRKKLLIYGYIYVLNNRKDYGQNLHRTPALTWKCCVPSCVNNQTTSPFPEISYIYGISNLV